MKKALKIVSKTGNIHVFKLKEEYNKTGEVFDSRMIGTLCGGETPNCSLKQGILYITPAGRKNLGLPAEPDDKKTPKKPVKPRPKPRTVKTDFVETNNEVPWLVYGIDERKNCLLTGPTGCGKSFLIEEVAKAMKKKLWTVNCDVELDKTEIVGHYEVIASEKGTETKWIRGILPMAMENGDWIVLDEVNMARPEVMSILHQALDHRRTLTIKEHGNEEIKAHPEFRVFATMNPEYSGTAELNYAFRRRFEVIIGMDYLSSENEKKLIMDKTKIDGSLAGKCVLVGQDSRESFRDNRLDYPVSTAHLLEFATMLKKNTFTPIECAKVTLNISDNPAYNQDVLNIVRSYF